MNFTINKGKHCVETWATICDQNNPIINRDNADKELCDISDLLSNSNLLSTSIEKQKDINYIGEDIDKTR